MATGLGVIGLRFRRYIGGTIVPDGCRKRVLQRSNPVPDSTCSRLSEIDQ